MSSEELNYGEQRKRIYELLAAVIIIALLWGMARLEARLFEIADFLSQYKEFVNTLSYFALINLNVILILLLSFLLFRNIVRLVIERKRGVIGSRLKTKLIVALVFFALAPSLLIVYVSTQFITQSFVGWFSDQVSETIKLTREAGAAVYKQDQKRLRSLARIALQNIEVIQPDGVFYKGHPTMRVNSLDSFPKEYGIHSIKIYRPGGLIFWVSGAGYQQQVPYAYDDFVEKASEEFQENVDELSSSIVEGRGGQDVVKGAAPLFDPVFGNLVGIAVAEERFESQLLVRLENVLADFARLKPEAQLIRLNYMIIMILMMLLIVFSAIWLGFYVAKGITGPLQSLAEATREVALGNYGVSLKVGTDDETGQLVKAFNVMTKDLEKHEITTRDAKLRIEKSNEELAEKKQHLEVVLKSITAGVISLDEHGQIEAINKAAEKLLLVDSGTVAGRMPKDAFSPEFYELLWAPIEARIVTGRMFQGQVNLSDIGREEILIVRAVQILDDDGSPIGGVVVLDDAQDEVRAQKAAAWKEVARRIAHEIKNPMTPIKLNAQRIQRRFSKRFEGEDAEVFEKCLQTILLQVDQLRDLVNEFASFSKLPDTNMKMGDINVLIREVFDFYSVGHSAITWGLSLDESAPEFAFDKDQLRRVFVNLIGNSVEAIEDEANQLNMPGSKNRRPNTHKTQSDGRSVKLMRSSDKTDTAKSIKVKTNFISDLNMLRVEVEDTGPGIPNHLKSKVLEPYVSTKEQGTGLGLAIVSQIVADHGGYIRIIDNEPRGTLIAFEIPIRAEGQLGLQKG